MILAVFGETMESSYSAYLEEAEKPPVQITPVQAAPVKTVSVQAAVQVEPNAQWAGALSNIIKQFKVMDVKSGKTVGQKELPILNRKIEDIPWEKLLFYMASDDEAAALRIRKGDTLWIQEVKEVQTEGIYLLERQNSRQICRIQKQASQWLLSRGAGDTQPVTVDPKAIRIIGRCVKVEFPL